MPRIQCAISRNPHVSDDDACIQSVFAVQDGLGKDNGIPAADQDIPLEVHISGWEDHQNGQKRGDEAF